MLSYAFVGYPSVPSKRRVRSRNGKNIRGRRQKLNCAEWRYASHNIRALSNCLKASPCRIIRRLISYPPLSNTSCALQIKTERMRFYAHEKLSNKLADARHHAETLRLAARTRRAEAASKAANKAEVNKTSSKFLNLMFLTSFCK